MIGTSPIIYTRDQLKDYIIRNLGGEAVNVELTDANLEDAINQAISEFVQYAFDAIEKRWKLIDVTGGVQEYTLDYQTFAVTGVYQSTYVDYSPAPADMFSINQYIANDMASGGIGKVDLLTMELVQEQISTLGIIFGGRISYNYNALTKKLYLETDVTKDASIRMWNGAPLNKVWIEYYKTIDYTPDPTVQQNIYDNKWVQQYSTALARYQWGINLMKHEGSTLPNGLTLNSQGILQLAKEEISELKEQLHNEWEVLPDFFIG